MKKHYLNITKKQANWITNLLEKPDAIKLLVVTLMFGVFYVYNKSLSVIGFNVEYAIDYTKMHKEGLPF